MLQTDNMHRHPHPYPPFIPEKATKLIVGTLPPPRFSKQNFKPGDVDFNYGSRDGQLWVILGRIFNIDFPFETTQHAIEVRKAFLQKHNIGICDMVAVAYREKLDASDIGIRDFELRNLIKVLREFSSIKSILFTGGNSKNGPEYFFRKHLKNYDGIKLKRTNTVSPRVHEFKLDNRMIKTVSLTAPSGAANRSIGARTYYKEMKKINPNYSVIDFRVDQYTPFFTEKL